MSKRNSKAGPGWIAWSIAVALAVLSIGVNTQYWYAFAWPLGLLAGGIDVAKVVLAGSKMDDARFQRRAILAISFVSFASAMLTMSSMIGANLSALNRAELRIQEISDELKNPTSDGGAEILGAATAAHNIARDSTRAAQRAVDQQKDVIAAALRNLEKRESDKKAEEADGGCGRICKQIRDVDIPEAEAKLAAETAKLAPLEAQLAAAQNDEGQALATLETARQGANLEGAKQEREALVAELAALRIEAGALADATSDFPRGWSSILMIPEIVIVWILAATFGIATEMAVIAMARVGQVMNYPWRYSAALAEPTSQASAETSPARQNSAPPAARKVAAVPMTEAEWASVVAAADRKNTIEQKSWRSVAAEISIEMGVSINKSTLFRRVQAYRAARDAAKEIAAS